MATKKATAKKSPKTRGAKVAVSSATPFLWFDDNAQEAAEYYATIFKGAKVMSADPMSVTFKIAGQKFVALNGGPTYKLTPAFSIFVSVKTQKEVDDLWAALTKGGEESRCGWLVDRFGVSWQIIPEILPRLLNHKDPCTSQAAVQAMMKMGKIDIAALKAAVKSR